jgi:hypothetical protein
MIVAVNFEKSSLFLLYLQLTFRDVFSLFVFSPYQVPGTNLCEVRHTPQFLADVLAEFPTSCVKM